MSDARIPLPKIDKLPLKGATGFTAVRDIWYNMSIYVIPDIFCHSSPPPPPKLQHAAGVRRGRRLKTEVKDKTVYMLTSCGRKSHREIKLAWSTSAEALVGSSALSAVGLYIVYSPLISIGTPCWNQVGPPFAFGTTLIYRVIDSRRGWKQHSSEILVQIDMIHTHSSCRSTIHLLFHQIPKVFCLIEIW